MINRILLICVTLIFSFCSKSEPQPEEKPECEKEKYGTVTISNTSTNPYEIKVDGVVKITIAGKAVEKIQVKEGNGRALLATQKSGYVFTPTEVLKNLNVIKCSEYSWQIP
jgi:hypothetical protein